MKKSFGTANVRERLETLTLNSQVNFISRMLGVDEDRSLELKKSYLLSFCFVSSNANILKSLASLPLVLISLMNYLDIKYLVILTNLKGIK